MAVRTRISSGRLTPGLAKWDLSHCSAKCPSPGLGGRSAVQHSSQPGARSSQEQALEQREPLCDWLAKLG